MSDTYYQIDGSRQPQSEKMLKRWGVPVVPCEHGNINPHIVPASITVAHDGTLLWGWCPGTALGVGEDSDDESGMVTDGD